MHCVGMYCATSAGQLRGLVDGCPEVVEERDLTLELWRVRVPVDGQLLLRNLAQAFFASGGCALFCLTAFSARQTCCGVVGMSMCRTPRWEIASMPAFCPAGVE